MASLPAGISTESFEPLLADARTYYAQLQGVLHDEQPIGEGVQVVDVLEGRHGNLIAVTDRGKYTLSSSMAVVLQQPSKHRGKSVKLYCEYGSLTKAELFACLAQTPTGSINRLNTDAAQFARGELVKCARTSGPYCHDQPPDYGDQYGY